MGPKKAVDGLANKAFLGRSPKKVSARFGHDQVGPGHIAGDKFRVIEGDVSIMAAIGLFKADGPHAGC